jgi:DNA polymerase
VHNLPQNKIPDIDLARELVANKEFDIVELMFGETPFVFSQLVRTAFVASEGCRFVVSDFSAIEARVISYLADEEWRLEVFRTHGKIYEASASQMFHVPIEQITKGSKLRQKGKVAELALGYQGSVGALMAMGALDMGLDQDELPMLVNSWREANKRICKLWYVVEAAAKAAINEHRTVKIQHGVEFSYINKILFIKLPSGRKLAYYDARIETVAKGKEQITYAGVNQETKVWGRLETYGGKLVENIVQATARDCLAVAMKRVDAAGYNIVMHVHDEMVVDVPEEDTEATKTITALMGQNISWAPGLPLRGDTYETPFYKKD